MQPRTCEDMQIAFDELGGWPVAQDEATDVNTKALLHEIGWRLVDCNERQERRDQAREARRQMKQMLRVQDN
jgi:hypothetical protein